MQARLALEHGRPVVLMKSLLEHEWAQEYARRPVFMCQRVAEVRRPLIAFNAPDSR